MNVSSDSDSMSGFLKSFGSLFLASAGVVIDTDLESSVQDLEDMIVLQRGWWAITAAEVVIDTDLESSKQDLEDMIVLQRGWWAFEMNSATPKDEAQEGVLNKEEIAQGCKPKEYISKSDATIDVSHFNRHPPKFDTNLDNTKTVDGISPTERGLSGNSLNELIEPPTRHEVVAAMQGLFKSHLVDTGAWVHCTSCNGLVVAGRRCPRCAGAEDDSPVVPLPREQEVGSGLEGLSLQPTLSQTATPRWGQDPSYLGPTLMMRGGATDTPLPQVLSSMGAYTQEGEEEDILDAGTQSSGDEDLMPDLLNSFGGLDLTAAEKIVDSSTESGFDQDMEYMDTVLEHGWWVLEMGSAAPLHYPKDKEQEKAIKKSQGPLHYPKDKEQEEAIKKTQCDVLKKAQAGITSQGPYPARDLRDLSPAERRAIWRAKLREFKAKRAAQKKKGWSVEKVEAEIRAMEKRLTDEGGD